MLLGLDSRAARKASPVQEVEYSIQAIPSPRLRSDTITTRALRISRTRSLPPRDRVPVAVAARRVGAHPPTGLPRPTFPVRYPVRAPERATDGRPTPHAATFDFRSSWTGSTFPVRDPVRAPERGPDGRPTPHAATFDFRSARAARGAAGPPGRLLPRPPPAGAEGARWLVGDPPGLTPPVSERAPPPGPDQAPPRRRDGGRREARATPPWSRSATPQRAVDPELAPPPEPGRFPCQLEGPNDCTASTYDR